MDQGLLEEPNYNNVVRRWINWAQGRVKEPLLWEFARKSGACFDWLYDLATKKDSRPLLWDGYYKGPDYTEYPVTHIFYQADKLRGETINFTFYQGSGVGDVYGNAVLVPALYDTIEELGGEIRWETKSERLVRDGDGPVTGAIVATGKNEYTQINAKSVIIASGDYAADDEMFQYYSPMTAYAMDGRFLQSARRRHRRHAQAGPVGRRGQCRSPEPHSAVMHLDFGAASYGFLHVNWDGKRFKNEDVNTQSKSVTKALQTQKGAWTILRLPWPRAGEGPDGRSASAAVCNGVSSRSPWAAEYNLEAQQIVPRGRGREQPDAEGRFAEAARREDGRAAREPRRPRSPATTSCAILGKDLDYGKRPRSWARCRIRRSTPASWWPACSPCAAACARTPTARCSTPRDQPIEGPVRVRPRLPARFFGAGDYPHVRAGHRPRPLRDLRPHRRHQRCRW